MCVCCVLTLIQERTQPLGYAKSPSYLIGTGIVPSKFSGSFERLALTAPRYHYSASGLNLSKVHTRPPGFLDATFGRLA